MLILLEKKEVKEGNKPNLNLYFLGWVLGFMFL